jgi:hypothetical protein
MQLVLLSRQEAQEPMVLLEGLEEMVALELHILVVRVVRELPVVPAEQVMPEDL